MKNKMTVIAILAALLLGGAYYLRAQMGGYNDNNMDDPRRQEERQPAGRMMGMPGGMGAMGGGAAMAVFERHIYVLSGNTLYKVDPLDMKVMKELQLRRPGAPAGGPQGRPGTMGGQ